MSDKIGVTLSSTALEVNAGESVEFTATIHNRSQVVDQFTIGIEGLDPAWYDLSVASVSLFPGDKDEVKITIHPPKTAETKAGSYPFTVKAVSGANPEEFTAAEASLTVHTFAGLGAEMSPTRVVGRSGTYIITLNNQGNADVTQSFEASDPEEALSYTFKPKEITVPAGGSATVELSAQLKKKPKVAGEKEYPFQVVVKPTGADKFSPEAKTLNGQLVYEHKARPKPRIPRWLIALIAVVAAVIIGLLLFRSCAISPPHIIFFDYKPADHGYMLLWTTEGAAEGNINGGPIEEEKLDKGSMLVQPATRTKYVLKVSNRAGGATCPPVVIQPPPIIEFFKVEWIERSFLLSWSVKEAEEVCLNDERIGLQGNMEVHPDEPTKYVLHAKNEGGEIVESRDVVPAAVTVASPNGGEEWFVGSVHNIRWEISNPEIDGSPIEPGIRDMRLEYSTDGGDTWHLLGTMKPQATFSWTIPNTPSTRCLVRATIYSSKGNILRQNTSDELFTITAQYSVELLTPKEGEKIPARIRHCPTTTGCYYTSNKYRITWESEGAGIDHVSLAYKVEGGSWHTIGSNLPNTGSYLWTVPNYKDAGCYLRIIIYGSEDNKLDSDTNGPFLIYGGELSPS